MERKKKQVWDVAMVVSAGEGYDRMILKVHCMLDWYGDCVLQCIVNGSELY